MARTSFAARAARRGGNTGADATARARKTGVSGADTPGTLTGDELFDAAARDSSFRLQGDTVVAGRDERAIEAACLALKLGSAQVTLVCPYKASEFPVPREVVDAAIAEGVRFVHGWGPQRVDVHADGRVSGVFFKHCDRALNDQGRFSPRYDESNVMAQYCDNAILA